MGKWSDFRGKSRTRMDVLDDENDDLAHALNTLRDEHGDIVLAREMIGLLTFMCMEEEARGGPPEGEPSVVWGISEFLDEFLSRGKEF